jgi:hypothetical protein
MYICDECVDLCTDIVDEQLLRLIEGDVQAASGMSTETLLHYVKIGTDCKDALMQVQRADRNSSSHPPGHERRRLRRGRSRPHHRTTARPVYFLDECCRVDLNDERTVTGVTMLVSFELGEILSLPETVRWIAEHAVATVTKKRPRAKPTGA